MYVTRRVVDAEVAARRRNRRFVVGLDEHDVGGTGAEDVDAAVAGRVVDDDDLELLHRPVEATKTLDGGQRVFG